jgi:hypothetical protein
MNKLACGIATLGLLAGSVFASNSYYIFSGSNLVAWGTENYVMGFTYGTVTLDNPENSYSPGDKDFVNEGVGKIVNASVSATASGVFIGAKKTGNGAANDKSITDCIQGFSYWYKGGAHDVILQYPESECSGTAKWNNKWRVAVASQSNWTKKSIALSELTQVTGGDCNKTSVNLSIAEQLAWGTEAQGTGYNLMIGNVACLVDGVKDDDVAPTANFTWVAGDDVCNGYFCQWATCGVITTDKNAATPITSCAEAIANCKANSPSEKVYSNNDCTTEIDDNTSSSSGGTTSSSSGDTPSSSSTIDSSSSSDGGSSSSDDDGTPIISYNSTPIAGLNVAYFARSLQIASGKAATVYLFDMHGKQVFWQKVLSGTTTINLEKQRQGIYYAIARSGSQKQIVKIVLK